MTNLELANTGNAANIFKATMLEFHKNGITSNDIGNLEFFQKAFSKIDKDIAFRFKQLYFMNMDYQRVSMIFDMKIEENAKF